MFMVHLLQAYSQNFKFMTVCEEADNFSLNEKGKDVSEYFTLNVDGTIVGRYLWWITFQFIIGSKEE